MQPFTEYRAINYFHGNPQGVVSLVAIHPYNPERLHWNGGQTYATGIEGIHYITLQKYAVSDFIREIKKDEYLVDDLTEAEEAIEMQFYRDFYKPIAGTIKQSASWIAPHGKFYSCRFQEYDSLAKRLSTNFYQSLSGVNILEEKGWILIDDNGIISHRNQNSKPFTQAQLNTFVDLQQVSTLGFRKNIIREVFIQTPENR